MRLRYFGAILGCFALVACDSGEETTTEDTAYVGEDSGGAAADFIATAGDRVFYEFNKSDLSPEAMATLDRQVAWLLAHPEKVAVIQGHCDDRGGREFNLALGERRAHEVVSYLILKGLPEHRVSAVSYGKDRPIEVPGADREEFWRQNRTAITVIQ
jgi:peptidoglycan-associated lipoprotein